MQNPTSRKKKSKKVFTSGRSQNREEEQYYEVEKILDMKQQGGKTYYLVKWLNWDIKTCTWEQQQNVQHLKSLIKQFHLSKKFDKQNNLGLKKFDWVQPGLSPYEATKFYGHFLYGDEPQSIMSVQMMEKKGKKELHFQIEWKPRSTGFKPTNSMIESKMIEEHAPQFLVKFFQRQTRLMVQQQQ